MKLIFAIMNDEDAYKVTDALNSEGCSVTKLCSTGGFLRAGNTTMLIGIEDNEIDKVLRIIKDNSKVRKQQVKSAPIGALLGGVAGNPPLEVTVGGATIFITSVEKMEKY